MTKLLNKTVGGRETNADRKASDRNGLRRFGRDEEGGLIIFSLFILVCMLLVTGLAVDLMRFETHRARLQSTLDRAVLAGASLEQTLNSEDVVLDYFDKAGLGQFIKEEDVVVVETATSKTVSATSEMNMLTFFMRQYFRRDDTRAVWDVQAGGRAEESVSDVEISLIVDVSGSMGENAQSGGTKIDVLKVAAKEFVYLMQCDPDAVLPFNGVCVVEPNTVSISMVPYNHQVIAGETLIQKFNITEEHQNSSCIDMDPADYLTIPIELDPLLVDPFFGVPDPTPNVKRSTQLDFWTGYGGYSGDGANNDRRECSPNTAPYTARTIVPYENNYLDMQTAIDGLYAGGNTSIDLAAKWGGALLAPEFRAAVTSLSVDDGVVDPAFIGRPFNYDRPSTRKVIVLMTDGKNTSKIWVEDEFREGISPFFVVDDAHNTNPPGIWEAEDDHISIYNASRDAHGHRPFRRLSHKGDGNSGWSWNPDGGANATQLTWNQVWERYHVVTVADAMDDGQLSDDRWWKLADYDYTSIKDPRLQSICTALKDEDVLIYTIGFETSTASNLVLSNCASSENHHFDVQGLDLTSAFNSIARDIHELRLIN